MASTSIPPSAGAAAVVTPTIDEHEQASFYASAAGGNDVVVHGGDGHGQQQILLHQQQQHHQYQQQQSGPCIPSLEHMVDTTLPSTSFYSPAVASAPSIDVPTNHDDHDADQQYETLESYIGTTATDHHDGFESIASLASVAAAATPAATVDITQNNNMIPRQTEFLPVQQQEEKNDNDDMIMLEAANILCQFKDNATVFCMECSPSPSSSNAAGHQGENVSEIIDKVVDMLTDEKISATHQEEQEYDGEYSRAFVPVQDYSSVIPRYELHATVSSATVASSTNTVPVAKSAVAILPQAQEEEESLHHPDRLAHTDDHEEVNKLHQYVRRDLLEIFVVPQASGNDDDDSDDEGNDDDDEDASDGEDDNVAKSTTKKSSSKTSSSSSSANNNDTTTSRRLVTRRRSIPITQNVTSTNSVANRHYPGRVGLRCVYCANIRRKSTSKAAFFPLRLKNIYREVCAWQRIHFKKCKHVPSGVRDRYDHYKRIDTSRGKVRYWESSAKKIGLVNNPDRDDGIVFANPAWRP